MSDKRRNSDKQSEMDAMKEEIETLKSMLNDLASKITS
jgi:polyhydroxyalkanoate synthesis regulator phasin